MNLDVASRNLRNNFDVLRIVAATMVLVSHSFVVVGAHEPHVGHFPLGTLGVEIFFAISGFLVAKSWIAQPQLRAFLVKRALRILPALVACALLTALVLGPLVTHESPRAYLTSAAPYTYVIDNVGATATANAARHVALDLPGVFTDHADHAANRSLWTLPIEVQAYTAIALLGLVGLLTLGLPAAVLGLFALSLAGSRVADLPLVGHPLNFIQGADGENAHLITIFLVSALLYRHRARIALRGDLAALAGGAFLGLLLAPAPLQRVGLVVCIPYLALFLAYRTWGGLRAVTTRGDVSYGLYLYAFPVQQTIVGLWGGGGPRVGVIVAIALPVTYALAFCSWHLVEKRALRLKAALAGASAPAPATAVAPAPAQA